MKKESYLYSGLAGGTVRCGTCRRRCVGKGTMLYSTGHKYTGEFK